jgi:trk system potassium uptake protein TrkH
MALARVARLGYTDGQIVRATLFGWFFAVTCGTAMLVEGGRGLLASISQAAAAFGNSGVFLGRLPGVTDWRTHAALLPLSLLGGLSIPVLMELTDSIFRRRMLSVHSRVVLTLTAGLYLFGLLALSPWGGQSDWTTTFATGSAMSIDGRSCGFPYISIGVMARPAQWMLIGLMLIGAAPAGAGGGIKVTTLFHFGRGTRRALSSQPGERITGIAAVWIATYLLIVLVTLLALLAALPELPADRLVFLAVSAVGTVGLSHDPVSFAGPGLIALSAAMLIGRIAPLLVLWWTASTTDDADVAVG